MLFGANIALAQVSRQGLYCEQFNDKTTCRENSCAFFAERGSCESLCLAREDTWAFLYQLGSEVMFSSESADEDCMMHCINTPDCTVYSIFMGVCRIGSAIDESYGWPLVNMEGAVYGECVDQSSELQIWTPTTHDPTPLPSQSPSSLACEQMQDETTCRENSCAFFAEQGSCESSCFVYENTWPFFYEIGAAVMVSSDEECMARCLNDQQCTVYSTFMGNCRIGRDLLQSQEPFVVVPGAVYGICWARFHESSPPTSNPISVSNKPSEMPTRAPTTDNPTSVPSHPVCQEFKEEMTCRENGCAFFAEGRSCETSCLVHENTWAFLQQIGGEYSGHSDAQCMTRCLNTPDCTVYSTFMEACRIGSLLDDSFNEPLVNVQEATYGVCLTRFHEPTTAPTSDHPSEMPTRSTTADYSTTAPSYDAPDAEILNSMGKLLERDPSASRFVKVGRRAADILQQKKLGDVLHPDVRSAMRTIKSLSKRGFTESRWNKMATQYQTVRAMGY